MTHQEIVAELNRLTEREAARWNEARTGERRAYYEGRIHGLQLAKEVVEMRGTTHA